MAIRVTLDPKNHFEFAVTQTGRGTNTGLAALPFAYLGRSFTHFDGKPAKADIDAVRVTVQQAFADVYKGVDASALSREEIEVLNDQVYIDLGLLGNQAPYWAGDKLELTRAA